MPLTLLKRQPTWSDIDYIANVANTITQKDKHKFLLDKGWRFMGNGANGYSFYANLDLIDAAETFTQGEAMRITSHAILMIGGLMPNMMRFKNWWIKDIPPYYYKNKIIETAA